jgi:hypothetical protein
MVILIESVVKQPAIQEDVSGVKTPPSHASRMVPVYAALTSPQVVDEPEPDAILEVGVILAVLPPNVT